MNNNHAYIAKSNKPTTNSKKHKLLAHIPQCLSDLSYIVRRTFCHPK